MAREKAKAEELGWEEESKKNLTLPKQVGGGEQEEYDYHAERNRLDEEITSMPPIKVEERKRLKREKIGGHYRTSRRGSSSGLSARGKDNLGLAALLTVVLVPLFVGIYGVITLNWYAMSAFFIELAVFVWLGFSGSNQHCNNNGGDNAAGWYYLGTRRGGSGFRMWAADRSTRKRR